ncbi:MAG: C69 family dipeptidase [Solobacterium sp.]|nr:C69 family dipeptidase [Solobacterium sp.]
MKIAMRLLSALGFSAVFAFSAVIEAKACTAVYVGSEASEDGTVIMAKSNDYQDVWANYITVTERVENEPGRTMPVDNGKTVFAPIPDTTYRYTSTPWMDSATEINGLGSDATVCANEYGVSMIISITSFSNKAALAADPLIEEGLTEFTAVDLVVCQSRTAREAVEVLGRILDEYGSSEVNIALIADQKEAWYFEMYNGHQWAAVKLPEDAVCVFGNEFSLEYLSDYEDSVVSKYLESLAVENSFAVYGRNGELNLLDTYSGSEVVTDYSHRRTWIGHQILAPSQYGEYDKTEKYPLCFEPEKKVSLQDVMEIMRNRFEGTEFNPDETGRTDIRVIGTDTALSVHAAQIYKDLPADISCVTWESSGPALYGVFVPVSNGVLSISEPYSRNQSAEEAYVFDTENYPYYRFKELNTLGVEKSDYKTYGEPVRAYWHEAETIMVKGMDEILRTAAAMSDHEAAKQYITDYCSHMQNQAFEDAGTLLNDVRWYRSHNSNTMKNGRNPETHEVIDELKRVDPLTVTLDPSVYDYVPEAAAEPAETPEKDNTPLYITFGVIAAALIAVLAFRKTKKA